MNGPQVCRHGTLRRKCEPCDLADEIDALRAVLAELERAVSFVSRYRDAERHPDVAQALVKARTVLMDGRLPDA